MRWLGGTNSAWIVGLARVLRRPLSAKDAFSAPPMKEVNRRIQAARGARLARFLERPPLFLQKDRDIRRTAGPRAPRRPRARPT